MQPMVVSDLECSSIILTSMENGSTLQKSMAGGNLKHSFLLSTQTNNFLKEEPQQLLFKESKVVRDISSHLKNKTTTENLKAFVKPKSQ